MSTFLGTSVINFCLIWFCNTLICFSMFSILNWCAYSIGGGIVNWGACPIGSLVNWGVSSIGVGDCLIGGGIVNWGACLIGSLVNWGVSSIGVWDCLIGGGSCKFGGGTFLLDWDKSCIKLHLSPKVQLLL